MVFIQKEPYDIENHCLHVIYKQCKKKILFHYKPVMTGLNSKLAQLAQGHSQLDLKVFRVETTLPWKTHWCPWVLPSQAGITLAASVQLLPPAVHIPGKGHLLLLQLFTTKLKNALRSHPVLQSPFSLSRLSTPNSLGVSPCTSAAATWPS